MSLDKSFLDHEFLVADDDARIRTDGNLLEYARYATGDTIPAGATVGDFKRISRNTKIVVQQIRIVETGSVSRTVFAEVKSITGQRFGWTSTRNLLGEFIGETLGVLSPETGASQYGPNAAWSAGNYLGQIDLVQIVDSACQIERIALSTLDAYFAMTGAAAVDGVKIALNSGFRSYAEQKYLWDGWQRRLPGFNKAAKPGRSNHQNGIAFDISVSGGPAAQHMTGWRDMRQVMAFFARSAASRGIGSTT